MPKYTFKCIFGHTVQKNTSISTRCFPCEHGTCSAIMERQVPKIRGLKVTETVDKLSNRKHVSDQKDVVKERKLDYYWEVEVPKMVNSGTYSLETMLEQGWVYYNEKKELVTRTKPPQKS